MEPGHIMNIDFGVKKEGFCSDIQRTWYFLKEGETEAPEVVKKAFKTITDSIQLCAEKIRPGMTGLEVDTMVRGYITERGYPEYPHATGHQVGRSAHDGAATLATLRSTHPDLPAVICSGYGEEEMLHRVGRDSAAGFLKKPFRQAELLAILRDILDDADATDPGEPTITAGSDP